MSARRACFVCAGSVGEAPWWFQSVVAGWVKVCACCADVMAGAYTSDRLRQHRPTGEEEPR